MGEPSSFAVKSLPNRELILDNHLLFGAHELTALQPGQEWQIPDVSFRGNDSDGPGLMKKPAGSSTSSSSSSSSSSKNRYF